jgi:hypothetical protein
MLGRCTLKDIRGDLGYKEPTAHEFYLAEDRITVREATTHDAKLDTRGWRYWTGNGTMPDQC